MSESALNKSTMIAQFKEYYDRSQSLLLENPKYLHLNIHIVKSAPLHLHINTL
jgi:hypothetical protein